MDLVLKLTSFVGGYAGSDNGPGDTASTAQSCFGRDENVGDILQQLRDGDGEADVSFLDFFVHFGDFYSSYILSFAYLVFCQQGQMEQNFNWFSVRSHHNDFADAAIESFGCCIRQMEWVA